MVIRVPVAFLRQEKQESTWILIEAPQKCSGQNDSIVILLFSCQKQLSPAHSNQCTSGLSAVCRLPPTQMSWNNSESPLNQRMRVTHVKSNWYVKKENPRMLNTNHFLWTQMALCSAFSSLIIFVWLKRALGHF